MRTTAGAKRRNRLAAIAALLCALVASLAVAAAPAAAEEAGSAEIPTYSAGTIGMIKSPSDPEEYPFRVELGGEQFLRQVNEQLVVVEYPGGHTAFDIPAPEEHDAEGATVPTSLSLGEGDVVTMVIHHREGNPAAGGAPFVYPITGGPGWAGGFRTISVELTEHHSPTTEPPPPSAAPTCTVPSLRNLSLRAAKARLRGADCAIGQVRLAAGATKGKGKVVKQFHAAGTELAAGAPVAVKLGSR